MKHNLMGKEKIENLGFDTVNSWDNEEKVSIPLRLPMTLATWLFLFSQPHLLLQEC